MPHDLTKATCPAMGGGYDLTKATQTASGPAAAAGMLRGARQAPATSNDHPLAGHSPPKATYSMHGKKGRRIMRKMFEEVHEDEPEVVGKTRRKKGAKAAGRQKVAIALSKARRAGVRIPKR